jgi:hypothetical protein
VALAGAATSEIVGTAGAGCGASQPSCGEDFAIIPRAASPYDCQAKVLQTPTLKMTNKRASLRKTRLPSDGRITAGS